MEPGVTSAAEAASMVRRDPGASPFESFAACHAVRHGTPEPRRGGHGPSDPRALRSMPLSYVSHTKESAPRLNSPPKAHLRFLVNDETLP